MLTIDQCVAANRPLMFVVAESDMEVLKHLQDSHKSNVFFVYSTTLASISRADELMTNKFKHTSKQAKSTIDVLTDIQNRDFQRSNTKFETYVFLDCQSYIHDPQTIRKIKDIIARYQLDENFTVSLIFISQTVGVPMQLERLSEVVFFDLPDEASLKQTSESLSEKLDLKKDKNPEKNTWPTDEVVNNLKGLTQYEVEQAYLQSFNMYKKVELNFIRDFKKNAIAKTDLLSLMESNVTFNDVGGLENLKNWIKKSYGGWSVRGKEYGLPLLKGLLLVGIPGTGKSLISKSIGNEWGLPVISFDPSRIFSSRVGDSEANMRRVLQIIENISPCLTGDARVTLSDGQVTSIKELYDNKYRGKVISINDKFNTDTSNIKLITKKQSNDLYNIRTSIGNIKATGNHKFPILKSNGEMHWVEIKDISKDDYIVCPRKINFGKVPPILDYFDDNTKFYSEVLCENTLQVIKRKYPSYYLKHGRRIRGRAKNEKKGLWDLNRRNGFVFKHELIKFKIDTSDLSHVYKVSRGGGGYQDSFLNKIPSEITEDLLYILGLLWSDGNIGDKGYWYYNNALKSSQKTDKYRQRNQNGTVFYNNEKKLHDEFGSFLFNTFGVSINSCFNGERNVTSYGVPLILSEFFRKLQKDLLSLSDKYIWAWLSGVMDGDGHVHKQRVNYSAVKHLNNEYLRDALLRVGIPVSSTKDDFKSTNAELTSAKFINIFKKNTQLMHPKKSRHLKLLAPIGSEKKCRFDTIDVRELLIKELIERDLIANYDIETHDKIRYQTMIKNVSSDSRKDIHNYIERKRDIDIDKVSDIFRQIDIDNKWFLNGQFFFSKVKSIDKIHGVHDVYDLCLDKNHNFIANRMFTHNCVLFIDEIEKGLAGMQSSTFSDSGVTARVIGSFLIWLQECTKPVFTVATANNIQYLPPELISRFDETFFVNMPQVSERQDIFSIHLKRLNRKVEDFDLKKLAEASQDLSGREIEQTLRESMYDAFYENKELTTNVILRVLSRKTSLLTTMAEQLDYLLKWVGWSEEKRDGIRARFASPFEDRARVQDEIDKLLKDVESKGGKK